MPWGEAPAARRTIVFVLLAVNAKGNAGAASQVGLGWHCFSTRSNGMYLAVRLPFCEFQLTSASPGRARIREVTSYFASCSLSSSRSPWLRSETRSCGHGGVANFGNYFSTRSNLVGHRGASILMFTKTTTVGFANFAFSPFCRSTLLAAKVNMRHLRSPPEFFNNKGR